MISAFTVVVITSLVLLVWMYPGYVFFMWLISQFKHPAASRAVIDDLWPSMSLMIMTYNEETVIRKKIENALHLDYPADKLEILVVDSASNDQTISIANSFLGQGVRIIQQPIRAGKAAAISFGLTQARHDIVVITDANAMMAPDALRYIAPHFDNPRIGGVTGGMQQLDQGGTTASQSGGMYWQIEQQLRQAESSLHSVIAMSGELSAYRKSIFINDGKVVDWYRRGATDDFEQTLYIIRRGLRVVYEPAAKVWEPAPDTASDLSKQKIRIITQTIRSILYNLRMVGNLRYGWYGLIILPSRKVLPLFSPMLLALTFIGSAILAANRVWAISLLGIQAVGYAIFGLSYVAGLSFHQPFLLVQTFGMLNILIIRSWWDFLRRRDYTVWSKIESSRRG